jgi:hypothetical protein
LKTATAFESLRPGPTGADPGGTRRDGLDWWTEVDAAINWRNGGRLAQPRLLLVVRVEQQRLMDLPGDRSGRRAAGLGSGAGRGREGVPGLISPAR